MIKKSPRPRPLFAIIVSKDDIFVDRKEAMEEYRRRIDFAINGKETKHA